MKKNCPNKAGEFAIAVYEPGAGGGLVQKKGQKEGKR